MQEKTQKTQEQKKMPVEEQEEDKKEIVVAPVDDESTKMIKEDERPKEITQWVPKTELGRKVKSGEIKSVSEILDSGKKIMEPQIVDILVPELQTELLLIGQSKGKFGGGQRRVFKQTQKKTMEGNKPKFSTCAVSGNKNGLIGMGFGKAKETIPAREKAFKNAKLNITKIRRGCGSWECGCKNPHSIPFAVSAKCGSVIVKLMPAPKGKGLCIQKECQKILNLAGIRDVYSKTYGHTKARINLIMACFDALKQLMEVKIQQKDSEARGILEGGAGETKNEE